MAQCEVCGSLGKFKCTRCGQACYCCAEHQREAWKEHKAVCKRLCAEAENAKAEKAKAEKAKAAEQEAKAKAAKPKAQEFQDASGKKLSQAVSDAAAGAATGGVLISECVPVSASSAGAKGSLHDGLCFYINLERRPDRRKRMEALASPHTWLSSSLERLPAVDGRELTWRRLVAERAISREAAFEAQRAEQEGLATMHEERPEEGPCHLTLGACGCALSHLKAWQMLLDRGSKWALILEDDLVSVCDNFDEHLGSVLARLPPGWLICYLGFHSPQGPPQRQLQPGQRLEGPYKLSEEGGWVAGLWCYVLSKAGAKFLLERCKPLTCQVDALAGIAAVEAGASYCLMPGEFLAFSKPTEVSRDTDIQTFPEEMGGK